jgi:hypothetical protein
MSKESSAMGAQGNWRRWASWERKRETSIFDRNGGGVQSDLVARRGFVDNRPARAGRTGRSGLNVAFPRLRPRVYANVTNRQTPGKRPLISRWVVGTAAVGWMTAAACGVWYEIGDRQRVHVADALADRALASSGASLRATVSELEQLGAAGVEPLVGLATSQRIDVASAAQQTVGRLLTSWEIAATERGDVTAFAEQASVLAAALDAHGDQFGAEGQRWANQLAGRLVTHSDQFPTAESWEILACCDRVLSRPLLPLAKPRVMATVEPSSVDSVATAAKPVAAPVHAKPEPKPAPSAPRTVSARPLADLSFVEPPMPVATARRLSEQTNNALRPPLRLPEEGNPQAASTPVAGPVIDVPSPQEVRLNVRAMRELSDRALVTRADDGASAEAAAARQALRERGFSDGVLELTRQLESLSPRERREALERAAQLPPTDARKVLRWFVADEDAEVRLQALTILATTGDPKLVELARERAVEDADPRVAAFASELMRTR